MYWVLQAVRNWLVLYGLVNRVISAQLLVLERNEVRPKIRHVYQPRFGGKAAGYVHSSDSR